MAGSFNDMADAVQADVAARERAERDAVAARLTAEHASRAKSTFLAAMSHEIRTPMIGVTGMLEVLAETKLTRHQRQMVGTAQSSAQSLLQIIGDILDFSKIEAGRLEIVPSAFELRPLMRTTVETFVHTASAKGLLLTWSADERLAPAHVGDPLRLRQIITNVLSNAVKFTEVGGIEVVGRVVDESSEAQTVEIGGHRHRHRRTRRAAAAPVRGVHTSRRIHHAAVRRDRPGPRDLQAPRGADGRRRDDGQRAGHRHRR